MAINTLAKRINIMSVALPVAWQLHPAPDGIIALPDRGHFLHLFHGAILVSDVIVYSIDGNAGLNGVQAAWHKIPIRVNNDKSVEFSNWAVHNWSIPTMTTTVFETLRGFQGAAINVLRSNDISARNSSKNYSKAILESVVNGSQQGLEMQNVNITFRVDITS